MVDRLVDLGLAGMFTRFDRGLSTVLGKNGITLSGGECQLIALARALYDRPAVVIIDEGICAMDLEVQEKSMEVLRQYARSSAVLLITHNLDTILRAQHVYLLDHCGVVEHGDPFTLLEQPGSRLAMLYAKRNPLMPMLLKQKSVSIFN
jgi:ABC-type multidrug transport system fused ATPase/permease subunit